MLEFNWSPTEKKIARRAFDKAYHNEIEEIKKILAEKVQNIADDKDVWELHNYLTKRRLSVDDKYDYRYSKLIRVFAVLLGQKFLTLEDLEGLSEDKLEVIKKFSEGLQSF